MDLAGTISVKHHRIKSLSHQYPRDALSPEMSSARRPVKAIVTLLPRRATLQSAFLATTLRDGAIFAHFVVGLLCNIDILLQSFS
jgi:hypothetical protein